MPEDMSVQEAFSTLGLDLSAHSEDVTNAHRNLTKKHHPDGGAGSNEQQSRLNSARDIALGYLRGGQLVPLEVKNAITTIERGVAKQHAATQAAQYSSQTIRN